MSSGVFSQQLHNSNIIPGKLDFKDSEEFADDVKVLQLVC